MRMPRRRHNSEGLVCFAQENRENRETKGPQRSWAEEVYGEKAFRPEEKTQEAALNAQALSLDVAASIDDHGGEDRLQRNEEDLVQGDELPQVSRGQVFTACAGTSVLFVFLAGWLRSFATAHGAPESLVSDPEGLGLKTGALALGCTAMVTLGRVALLSVNQDFARATRRSNDQVLSPLKPYDYVWLALLTGASEELLFRGALLPATTYDDWRAVLISAAVFGYFHRSGGRNWVFAIWSTVVGAVYGAAFVHSGNLLVPMVAHSCSNLASAAIWRDSNKRRGEQNKSDGGV